MMMKIYSSAGKGLRDLSHNPWSHYLIIFLLIISLAFKFIYLGQVPGINADEAYWSVVLQDFSNGVGEWPWSPPTTRLMNPLYPALIWIANHVFPLGFGYLRIISVFADFVLLIVAFLVIKGSSKWIDKFIFILLLSSLPLHTVFARLAWEPCLIPLFSFLTIHFAMERKFFYCSLALVVGILVHPTLVFLSPIVFILWIEHFRGAQLSGTNLRRQMICLLLLAEIIFAICFYTIHVFLREENWQGFLGHLGNFWMLIESFGWLLYSIVGTTVFAEFTGGHFSAGMLGSLSWLGILMILLFASLCFLFFKKRRSNALLLTIGLFLSLILFYIGSYFHGAFVQLNENWVWEVGYQRFILWLGAPVVFLIYEALSALGIKKSGAIVLASAALTYTVYGFFIKSINQSAFVYPPVYATGLIEPKQAAYEWVKQAIHSQRPKPSGTSMVTPIVAEDWWLFWPGRYWLGDSHLEFSYFDQGGLTFFPSKYQALTFPEVKRVLDNKGFVITFFDSPLTQQMRAAGLDRYIVYVAKSGSGDDLILVWHDLKK